MVDIGECVVGDLVLLEAPMPTGGHDAHARHFAGQQAGAAALYARLGYHETGLRSTARRAVSSAAVKAWFRRMLSRGVAIGSTCEVAGLLCIT